jgi:hypothetical protein
MSNFTPSANGDHQHLNYNDKQSHNGYRKLKSDTTLEEEKGGLNHNYKA